MLPLEEAQKYLEVVPRDQPFQVQLTLDLTNIAEHDIPLTIRHPFFRFINGTVPHYMVKFASWPHRTFFLE